MPHYKYLQCLNAWGQMRTYMNGYTLNKAGWTQMCNNNKF